MQPFVHGKRRIDKEYKKFMQNLLGFTVAGKSKYDDATVAMLSQLVKDSSGLQVKILNKKTFPF